MIMSETLRSLDGFANIPHQPDQQVACPAWGVQTQVMRTPLLQFTLSPKITGVLVTMHQCPPIQPSLSKRKKYWSRGRWLKYYYQIVTLILNVQCFRNLNWHQPSRTPVGLKKNLQFSLFWSFCNVTSYVNMCSC